MPLDDSGILVNVSVCQLISMDVKGRQWMSVSISGCQCMSVDVSGCQGNCTVSTPAQLIGMVYFYVTISCVQLHSPLVQKTKELKCDSAPL